MDSPIASIAEPRTIEHSPLGAPRLGSAALATVSSGFGPVGRQVACSGVNARAGVVVTHVTAMTRLRTVFVCLALAGLVLAGTVAPAAAQSFKWWQNDRFQRELALTAEQVTRLEDIYQAAGPAMRAQKAALDRLQADLSAMVTEGRADDPTAADLIARVETSRAELGRTRGMMLYRMRRLLTSDQHTKLKVLFDERERSRRGHSRPPNRF